jgi:hypothetical protein
VAGSCDHHNEYSGPIKGGNFLTSRATIRFSRRTLVLGIMTDSEPLGQQTKPVTF